MLVLNREGKKLPWGKVLGAIFALLLISAAAVWLLINRYHFHLVKHWPFLMK
jgi:hypothetical protein